MTKQKTARLFDACAWLSGLAAPKRTMVLVAAQQAASGSMDNPEGAFMREIAFQYDRGNASAAGKKGEQAEWKGGEKDETTKVTLLCASPSPSALPQRG